MDKYLQKVYTDPKSEGGFTSARRLWQFAIRKYPSLTLKKVKLFLQTQPSYTLHKIVRKNFPHARVIVSRKDSQWDADLADVSNIAHDNEGFKFLLVLIDILSRYATVIPLKGKSAQIMVGAFRRAFEGDVGKGRKVRKPEVIRSDKGTEFTAKPVREYLKSRGIRQFFAETRVKANFAERFIKTLKTMMYRYMTNKHTERYINVLPDLVHTYNNTIHSSINMTPASVTKDNDKDLWEKLYLHPLPFKKKDYTLSIDQQVRIAIRKGALEKGYTQGWSKEVYTVRDRFRRDGIPVYKLLDSSGVELSNSFYGEELQPVIVSREKKVSEVIQSRFIRGKGHMYHVRYENYGPTADV